MYVDLYRYYFYFKLCVFRSRFYLRTVYDTIYFLQVGELTGLLTSDLGSIKSVVSENISRDRGFRALTEASNSTPSTSELYVASIYACNTWF